MAWLQDVLLGTKSEVIDMNISEPWKRERAVLPITSEGKLKTDIHFKQRHLYRLIILLNLVVSEHEEKRRNFCEKRSKGRASNSSTRRSSASRSTLGWLKLCVLASKPNACT